MRPATIKPGEQRQETMKRTKTLLMLVSALAGLLIANASGQNLYVANFGNGSPSVFGPISEFGPSGNLINATFASVNGPAMAIAFDSGGNLYVANYAANTIAKFGPAGNLINGSFASGFNAPTGLAFDGNGNLYVSS